MQYKSTLHWFYRAGDAIFIAIILYSSLFIYGLTWEDKHTIISLVSVSVFSLICQYWGLYQVHRLSRRSGEYYIIIKGWVWCFIYFNDFDFYIKEILRILQVCY